MDISNISITNNSKSFSWYLGDDRVWYFDGMNKIPTDSFRWGGIIDLLAGPKLYRTISENIDDKSKYGLENPSTEISIYLNNGDKRTLYIGNETPDNLNNYAYLEGVEKLVMLDATWKGVLGRLVDEPPYPKWMYKLVPEEALEIVIIKDNEIYKAYAINDEGWHECDLPISSTPCKGNNQAEKEYIENILKKSGFRDIKIDTVYTSIATKDNVEKDAEMMLNMGPRAQILSEANLSSEKMFTIRTKIKEVCKTKQKNGMITYKACLNYVSAIK